jgi:5'-AMP-activated protein kinase regulatory beta subunit
MGNANGREDGAISDGVDPTGREPHAPDSRPPVRAFSSDSMANSPPQSPRRSRSPILFGPQVLSPSFFLSYLRFSCIFFCYALMLVIIMFIR